MKKTLFILSTALLLAACSNGADTADKATESASVATSEIASSAESNITKATDVDVPTEEIGDGYFNLVNASGDTSMGQPITVLYDPDTIGTDFDIETYEFDGSHTTYVYVDGTFVEKQTFSETQYQFDVPNEILKKEGTHIVSLVQYDNDEESGIPITVKHQAFEVENK